MLTRIIPAILAMLLISGRPTEAQTPITGSAFDSLMAAQNVSLYKTLDSLFPEDSGFFVTGPLDPSFRGDSISQTLYRSMRVICPSIEAVDMALGTLKSCRVITVDRWLSYLHLLRQETPIGYRGTVAEVTYQSGPALVQFNTLQQTRWLIWAQEMLREDTTRKISPEQWSGYARMVSEYLYGIDQKWPDAIAPKAKEYGLPDSLDLFPPVPAPVISSQEDYLKFLKTHAAITTDFAKGVISFCPGDTLWNALASHASKAAFTNKSRSLSQYEYLDFFARGGRIADIRLLRKTLFDTLAPGIYAFAVGFSGKVRFYREPSPDEVERFEKSGNRKLPRPAESFLFPGEPVLSVGRFTLAHDTTTRISEISAYSDHYLYNNYSPSIREDISEKSNGFVLSLGHFFRALNELKIDHRDVIIRKF